MVLFNGSFDVKLFKVIRNPSQETPAQCSIHNSMIIRKREEHHLSNSYQISLWSFNDSGFLFDGPRCHNCNLWLIDNRSSHSVTKCSNVCYCKGAALNIIKT